MTNIENISGGHHARTSSPANRCDAAAPENWKKEPAAITREGLSHVAPRVRLVEVGQMAGPTIALPAAALRGSGLEIYGSGGGTIPVERIMEAIPQFVELAADHGLRIETEQVPLAEVAGAWSRQATDNRRLVVIP
jgi:hypothetical protein